MWGLDAQHQSRPLTMPDAPRPAGQNLPGQRPAHVKPPAHLSPSPPVPAPQPISADPEYGGRDGPDPVRYGDW